MNHLKRLLWMSICGSALVATTRTSSAQAPAAGAAAAAKPPVAAAAKPAVGAANVPNAAVVKPGAAAAGAKVATPSITPRALANTNTGLQPLLINGRFMQPNGQFMPTTGTALNSQVLNGSAATLNQNALRFPANTAGTVNNAVNLAGSNVTTTTPAVKPGAVAGNFPANATSTQGSVSLANNQAVANANLQAANAGQSLQTQLGLSNSQVGQLNQFQAAYNQELTSLSNRFASDPQGTTSLINTAQQQLQQNINSALTPAQRQSLSKITGQPNPFSGAPATNAPTTGVAANTAANGAVASSSQVRANTPAVQNSNVNQNTNVTGAQAAGVAASNRALPQTNLQSGGFGAFSDPALQQRLNLSSGQLSQLRQFQLQHIQSMGELAGRFQSDPRGTQSLFNTMNQQSQQQINSVLTPQQQQLLSSGTGQLDVTSQSTSSAAPQQ